MLSSYLWGSASDSKSTTNTHPESQQPPPVQPQNDPPQPPQQQQKRPLHPLQRPSTKLLLGGTLFTAFSLLITRRALRKRHIAAIPPYYTSSTYHQPPVNGALDAFEALNLATVNVVSFAMVGAGAVLWKLDVHSLEDARALVRRAYLDADINRGRSGMGIGGDGGAGRVKTAEEEDREAERAIEKWVVETLGLSGYEEEKRKIIERKMAEEEQAKNGGK